MATAPLVLRGRVVTPEAVVADGVVVVEGGTITWVGPAADSPHPLPSPTGTTLLPGLVDLHCHGGGGAGFPEATDPDTARVAVLEHLAHGTTTLVASLVTADPPTLLQRTRVLAELVAGGDLAGIHLEGPFLSPARCGAQDPHHMRDGDPTLVAELARAAGGGLVTMTLAPEVPGVLGEDGALAAVVAAGAVPSVGHTAAGADLTRAALDSARRLLAAAGRSPRPTVTHLFNAMPPLHHRDPGPVAACLAAAARGDAVVELVADDVHLAPATVRAVLETVGPDAVALVTDAMGATGRGDGTYRLGTADVVVTDGVARLAAGGAVAGGTAHLLDVVRRTVAAGVPLATAVRAASTTPAAVLGRDDVGALAPGRRADVVVVDEELRPLRVLRDGAWSAAADPPVLPRPLHAEHRPGSPLHVRATTPVVSGTPSRALAVTRDVVAQRLGRALGATPPVHDDAPDASGPDGGAVPCVRLLLVGTAAELGPAAAALATAAAGRSDRADRADSAHPTDPADAADAARRLRGAYRLDVTADGAEIRAVAPEGLLHGATTLEQLVRASRDGAVRPVHVEDVPRYPWRGLAVDVARHPLPLADLLRLVDLAADLKLDVLHLHLTDDQGWRLEVPARPLLTERSGGTAVDGDPGGFLTVADWTELVAHAAARGVEVVPEIDLPGHVNAALHAYGELTPDGEPTAEYTGIEVGFSRLHADLPATEPFLRDVLTDVAGRTPGRHVHVGGDEVTAMAPEEYARLVGTAADAVTATGRTVVAWQEAAAVDLPPGSVLQLWDERLDTTALVAAASRGARVLLSPASRVYLDMRYDASSPLGLEWAGHVPVRRSWEWDPDDVVPGLDPRHVIGVEAAVWSETTRDLADVTWLLLPRLALVAEVAWSAPGGRSWPDAARRLARLAPAWDAAGLSWHRSDDVPW